MVELVPDLVHEPFMVKSDLCVCVWGGGLAIIVGQKKLYLILRNVLIPQL